MVSQTVEYALRAMSHLASLGTTPANSRSIALATRVPHGYLSKVMRDLVRAKLVRSFRGPNGGFLLARPPRQISVLDVVNAVDPVRRVRGCPLDNPWHVDLCPLHRCLDTAIVNMQALFSATSLAEVLGGLCEAGAHSEHKAPP